MTTARPQNVVWILGTGFSQPLGGPMLEGLLSPGLHSEVAIQYAAEGLGSNEMDDLLFLYNYGRRFKNCAPLDFGWAENPPGGEQLWEHAEDFLDILDTCAPDPLKGLGAHLFKILGRFANTFTRRPTPLKDLVAAAQKHVAAECCSFLDRNLAATERWRPYQRWARDMVEKQDTLITFNYDCLLERLDAKEPFAEVVTSFGAAENTPQNKAQVLKLHGSTSWTRTIAADGQSWTITSGGYNTALSCKSDERAIATPGPSKTRAATSLELWWGRAREAIGKADAVVFIGYRFPPSDSDARAELLGAIEARMRAHFIYIHTVLGPHLGDASARLEQMVRAIKPSDTSSELVVHRLYAQDFMSLLSRDRLFRAPSPTR